MKQKEVLKRRGQNNERRKLIVMRKRQVCAVAMILLIGICGYLNISMQTDSEHSDVATMYTEVTKKLGEAKMVNNSTDPKTEESEQTEGTEENENAITVDENYFENTKSVREKKRAESVETLKGIIESPEADKESKENASSLVTQLMKFQEAELRAESLIAAKGYGNCVVYIGENITTVAVSKENISEVDAAVITDTVCEDGVVQPQQVKIVEIKS